MGTSRSVAELSRKFTAVGDAVTKDNPRKVERIALFLKDAALDEAEAEIGQDRTFRNNRNRPAGARYKLLSSGIRSTAEVRATGAYSWLEYGVEPHIIVPGGRTKRFKGLTGISLGDSEGPALPVSMAVNLGLARGRKRGRKLRFENGTIRPYATNAGELKAAQSWTKARERTQNAAPILQQQQTVAAIIKGLQ